MTSAAVCPTCGSNGPAFAAMNDVVLALAADLAVAPILQQLVEASRQLVGARYAALGVPDGEGGFARFITSGISDKQREALGDLLRHAVRVVSVADVDAAVRVTDQSSR